MVNISSICVFCGSSNGRNPTYVAAAERLGADMAQAGIRLVYGGGSIGLMGAVARSVLANGGDVTGIIPEFLVRREIMLDGVTDFHVVPDMHTRKRMMFERADAFVALPGGIGTLEEVVEQMTWAQLGRHHKPIVLADIDGFWAPLMDLLSHMSEEAFIRQGYEVKFQVAKTAEEIVPTVLGTAETISHAALVGDAGAIAKL
ncbi:LOG family protein [Oryzibacter oryziterrae]|uniref:LOG family protein n=1 Tax=Oryzibacter oryziterrae TaxID=2766474 RepID=UPI001F2ED04D|nr:TIGR00730 family Rossman fold protein [Oryzibacter oryziterrae]